MNPTLSKRSEQNPERVGTRRTFQPLVDVFESKDELLVLADLPGVSKDAVTVNVEGGQLTIEARRTEKWPGQAEPLDFEYQRAFMLPKGIDASKIDAELKAGVLRVRLPKSEPHKPRRIEVKAS